jgi:pimeloyl-ACP methyl ester carboxylesterase
MAWFADSVAAALDELGVERAIVAGHSFGGQVALHLAVRRPELAAGLVLVAPSGIRSGTRVVQWIVAVSTFVRPGRLVARGRSRYGGSAWFRRAVFRPWFVADADRLSARATHGFLDGQPEHSDTAVAGRAMVADDPRPELEAVTCPAIVLWGACDAQLPLDDAFEYARRLHAPLRVAADCGHLVIGERPEAVLDGVRHLDVLVDELEARS